MVEPVQQPNLIILEDQDTEIVLELFPAIWQAAEKLLSSEERVRHNGLDDLLMTEAARVSPLIAYLLVTRLFDPNRELRTRIVEALANVMQRDANGLYASEAVRSQIISSLSQMGNQGLLALTEVGIDNQAVLSHIARLINFAPHAGNFLKDLAADRSQTIKLRMLAIYFIGRIGYVDAYSELLRIRNRIESSQFGQKSMPFAPPSSESEELLLPELKKVIITLGE
jgi:HEAT repeat protein